MRVAPWNPEDLLRPQQHCTMRYHRGCPALFLAACGGANTAASSTSSPLHGERLSNGKHPRRTSVALILRRRSRISRSRQARPAHRRTIPAYIQYRHILADGAHIIEPSEIDSKCHAALKAGGGSTLPEYVQNIDTYNAQPSVGVSDPSPAASTETSRTATNSSPPRRPGRSRLPR